MASPIEQFTVKEIVPQVGFTNSSLFMVVTVALVIGGFLYATRNRSVVPGRAQSIAEILHDFAANTLRGAAGDGGMVFFPLVFSLFMFVMTANYVGLLPGAFTVTSQIIVTASLALLVIMTVVIYGIRKHGLHFFGLFAPSGLPGWLLPFIILIEIVSFLSRPVSLSLRLFANMLAGHIALKVFGGFVVALGGAGILSVMAPLPLLIAAAITALEFLVCGLQAYVFMVLTCIYLNDALHPGH